MRVGFEFLARHLPADVYVSRPTWGNHGAVVEKAGYSDINIKVILFRLKVVEYPYYDAKTRGFDFNGMVDTLGKARMGSIVLLHVCAHNPTGVDPTDE